MRAIQREQASNEPPNGSRSRDDWPRRRLAARARFERLVSELRVGFCTIRSAEIEEQVVLALRRIAEEIGLDHASLAELTDGGRRLRLTDSWARDGVPRFLDTRPFA